MTISLNTLEDIEHGAIDISLVGTRVRSIRESIGYSIEDLAVTCGLIHDEIIDIEEGRDTDMGRLKRVAAALQAPLAGLLEGRA